MKWQIKKETEIGQQRSPDSEYYKQTPEFTLNFLYFKMEE